MQLIDELIKSRLPVISESRSANGDATVYKVSGTDRYFAFSGLEQKLYADNFPAFINSRIDRFIDNNLGKNNGLH